MSSYTAPSRVQNIFNPSNFSSSTSTSSYLTISTGNSRYLQLTGGTETGPVTFSQGLTTSSLTNTGSSILKSRNYSYDGVSLGNSLQDIYDTNSTNSTNHEHILSSPTYVDPDSGTARNLKVSGNGVAIYTNATPTNALSRTYALKTTSLYSGTSYLENISLLATLNTTGSVISYPTCYIKSWQGKVSTSAGRTTTQFKATITENFSNVPNSGIIFVSVLVAYTMLNSDTKNYLTSYSFFATKKYGGGIINVSSGGTPDTSYCIVTPNSGANQIIFEVRSYPSTYIDPIFGSYTYQQPCTLTYNITFIGDSII
jgi:hypothetical protein